MGRPRKIINDTTEKVDQVNISDDIVVDDVKKDTTSNSEIDEMKK